MNNFEFMLLARVQLAGQDVLDHMNKLIFYGAIADRLQGVLAIDPDTDLMTLHSPYWMRLAR